MCLSAGGRGHAPAPGRQVGPPGDGAAGAELHPDQHRDDKQVRRGGGRRGLLPRQGEGRGHREGDQGDTRR